LVCCLLYVLYSLEQESCIDPAVAAVLRAVYEDVAALSHDVFLSLIYSVYVRLFFVCFVQVLVPCNYIYAEILTEAEKQ